MNRPSTLRLTLVGLGSLALAMGIGRFAFTPMLPLMQGDGLLEIGPGGILASVHFVGYLLGAMSAAHVPLRPRRALPAWLLVIGLSTLGMGLTERYEIWLALRATAGVCSAWVLVLVGSYYVGARAGHDRTASPGWVFAGVGVGILGAGLACLAFMLLVVPSGHGWITLGVLSLAAAGVLHRGMGDELAARRPASGSNPRARRPADWGLVVPYGITGLGYTIPATFLPVMARDIAASPLVFGWAWPVFGLAALVSTVLAARAPSRMSNREVWAAGHVLMACGLMLPIVVPSMVAIAAAGLAVGGSFMVVTMVGFKEAHRIAPEADVTRHIAMMTSAFAAGQILGPLLASGSFALTGRFSGAVVTATALLLLSAVTLGRSSRRTVRSGNLS